MSFVKKFQDAGFEVRMNSVDGVDITDILLYNYYLTESKKKAYDFYLQFYFYAWKK